ncbi:MAG: von Willebrand factor type (vWA) domain-containing protein [Armatimonadetes bacterium]|jgi:Ca-activated chloride channel family protein|nr:von Willebrand factor type (vWA) domain-containing protein [Armatimonadota bacterium]
MDSTRIIGSQPWGGVGEATQLSPGPGYPGAGGFDPGRTAMSGSQNALSIELIPGNQFAHSLRSSVEHAIVQVDASGVVFGRRMPVNLCLVIDRSGSMEGEPLDYVKRACGHVVDLMDPNDILSVVTFDDRSEVVMPARRVVNKALVKEHINRIQPGNTTNLYDGIAAGASQVASVRSEGYVNRVMVLTDGEPTSGVKDYSSIVGCAAEQRTRGISTTALGFGPEYNEELLAGLAKRGGGNYYYIARPVLIPEVFRSELEQLLTLVAKNIRLRLVLGKWVEVRQVYGQQPAFGPRTVDVQLPDLERGASLRTLVELNMGRRPAATYRVARAEVSYDDCVTGAFNQRIEGDLVFNFVTDGSMVASGVNGTVQRELEVARASRNIERTMMGLKTQQLSTGMAMQDLQRTQMLLVQSGMQEQAAEVGQAIQGLRSGSGDAEKTLIGTMLDLDLGKRKG